MAYAEAEAQTRTGKTTSWAAVSFVGGPSAPRQTKLEPELWNPSAGAEAQNEIRTKMHHKRRKKCILSRKTNGTKWDIFSLKFKQGRRCTTGAENKNASWAEKLTAQNEIFFH
jgi:hypothetical protein